MIQGAALPLEYTKCYIDIVCTLGREPTPPPAYACAWPWLAPSVPRPVESAAQLYTWTRGALVPQSASEQRMHEPL